VIKSGVLSTGFSINNDDSGTIINSDEGVEIIVAQETILTENLTLGGRNGGRKFRSIIKIKI